MKKVIRFYIESSHSGCQSKWLLFGISLVSLLGGLANTALLATITRAVSRHLDLGWQFYLLLVSLGAVLGLARGAAQYLLTRLTIQTLVRLRVSFCQQIMSAPLAVLERLGSARLLASFTESMPTISHALIQLPNLVLYAIVLAGCLVYMAWLSWMTVAVVVALGACSVFLHRRIDKRAQHEFGRAHGYYMQLLKSFRGLIDGAKELKLHQARRSAYLREEIESPTLALAAHRAKSSLLYGLAEAWSVAAMFIAIVVILGMTRAQSAEVSTGFVLALLYLTPPIQGILAALPILASAGFAIDTLGELKKALGEPVDFGKSDPVPASNWSTITLESIEHRYADQDNDRQFRLGPLDLSIESGEVVFVTGGNGSGKTTLVKILAGLYSPDAGKLLVDGIDVTEEGLDRYRQNFSAIFADFHLFERLIGLDSQDEKSAEYLRQLRLDHKVHVNAGKLSTIQLSQGQKKRLALLTAYLEDRSIYIFDEWAADQDEEFREFFYREIIPGLKRRGKTAVVITHDERYFHLADRLVKLEYGRIIQSYAMASAGVNG